MIVLRGISPVLISAFVAKGLLHVVHCIVQRGLTKVVATGLCTTEGDAGDGLYQIPAWAFDGRSEYTTAKICGACRSTLHAMLVAPPKANGP
jgi:hypothetical protein